MTALSRRHFLLLATAGVAVGAAMSPATPSAEATATWRNGAVRHYRGRRIRITADRLSTADRPGFSEAGRMAARLPRVFIDDHELHLMTDGNGGFTTALHHHQTFPGVLPATRAAVDDLRGADLVPLPHAHQAHQAHAEHGGPESDSTYRSAALTAPSGGPYLRKDHNRLSAAEKRAFIEAVLALKRSGRYDDLVRTHISFIASDTDDGQRTAHRCPSFLPWHRRFLLEFEQALRTINPAVTVPYWNWTTDSSTSSALWAPTFLGGNGRSSDGRVTTGPFAFDNGQWPLNVRLDSRRYLRRAFRGSGVVLPSDRDRRQVLAVSTYDSAPWNSTSTSGFRNQLEGWRGPNLHNRVHSWVGGTMATGASPNDPVFWLHHCYVDKLWSEWQAAHPASGYRPDRSTANVVHLDQPMRPWGDTTPRDMLDHTRFYRYA